MAASRCILLSLPEEVIEHIIKHIPDDDDAVLNINLVCKQLYRLSGSPSEWRFRCRQLRYWEPKHNFHEKLRNPFPAEVNWRALFVQRFHVRKRTTQLLNEIISSPINRIPKYHEIGKFGYDAKDCLAEHAKVSEDAVDVLARRWYAGVALHYIHRRRAVRIWQNIYSHQEVSLEAALGCFELFNLKTAEGDPDETARMLDELAARFQSVTPNLHQLSTKAKASSLCKFMAQEGFRGASSEHYRALKNSFIGISLRTDRTNLPLTATAIFCSLATRIGLTASPCGFPYHVLAIVNDNGRRIYLDPFRGDGNELSIEGLENQLQMLGIDDEKDEYLRPSVVSEIVLRTARNILESLRHTPTTSREPNALVNRNSALYAALMASVLLGPRITYNLIQHMAKLIQEECPMDVIFFEQEIISQAMLPNCADLLQDTCVKLRNIDATPNVVNHRSSAEEVKYRVGTVFKHKRYNYQGVIFGWTRTCSPADGDEWIQKMGVDRLARGRQQPFYHTLVTDGTIRYVAEENINQERLESADELSLLAGKYFKRYSKTDGMFVSNIEDEYPDG